LCIYTYVPYVEDKCCQYVIFILSWLTELLLEKTVPIVNRIVPKVEELPKMDDICQQRGGDILNLSTNTEKPSKNITFKCHTSVENQRVVYSEIDSDSYVSFVEQNYFENCLLDKIDKSRFIDEDFPRFKGIGGQVTVSEYPSVRLKFQIGGALLSGRFIVTKQLTTSELLIGTDIMSKYGLPAYKREWKILIGSVDNPKCVVPCIKVLKKLPEIEKCGKIEFINSIVLSKGDHAKNSPPQSGISCMTVKKGLNIVGMTVLGR
jgi:hypothetical protein